MGNGQWVEKSVGEVRSNPTLSNVKRFGSRPLGYLVRGAMVVVLECRGLEPK
jgi:hypothetical protein